MSFACPLFIASRCRTRIAARLAPTSAGASSDSRSTTRSSGPSRPSWIAMPTAWAVTLLLTKTARATAGPERCWNIRSGPAHIPASRPHQPTSTKRSRSQIPSSRSRSGLRRYLVDLQRQTGSWTSFEVRTDRVQPTRDVSDLGLDLRSPLLELQLRASGYLTGNERIVRTVTHFGNKPSIPHPLTALLDDMDRLGKKHNSGLRSVLLTPNSEILEQEILREQQRLSSVIGALTSAGLEGATASRNSLLVGFWEDTDTEWVSDFGNWSASVLQVDNGQGVVVVRRIERSPIDGAAWPDITVPDAYADHAGATVSSWQSGDAGAVIAPLLGYGDRDARMMDLDTPLGQMIRRTYDIVGEGETVL